MSEPTNPINDAEEFVDAKPSKDKPASPFARVRQGVLLLVLVAALGLLGWEFLVARAGYQRVTSHLETLEDEYNSASVAETVGDEQGNGINEKFLADNLRKLIGVEATEVREYNNGSAIIEIYQWRRGNLYEVYELAVQYRKQGPAGKEFYVYTDWYSDLESMPINPAGAIEVDMDKALPPQEPNVTGGVGTGGNSESSGRRRRNQDNESDDKENDEGESTDDSTDSGEEGESSDAESSEDNDSETKEDGEGDSSDDGDN